MVFNIFDHSEVVKKMKKMVVLFSIFYGFLVSGLLVHFFMFIAVSSFPTDFTHFEHIFTKIALLILILFLLVTILCHIIKLKRLSITIKEKVCMFLYSLFLGLLFTIPLYFVWAFLSHFIY